MKKMEEVKEIFAETSEVFTQLVAAKAQVATEIAKHLSSIQTITNVLNALTECDTPQVLNTMQVNI